MKKDRSLRLPKIFPKNKLGGRMIKQFLNSVIAKYRDLSVSRRSIVCLSLRLWQIIDLLATDKSRNFAQPRPIIVNYLLPLPAPPQQKNCITFVFHFSWVLQLSQEKLGGNKVHYGRCASGVFTLLNNYKYLWFANDLQVLTVQVNGILLTT